MSPKAPVINSVRHIGMKETPRIDLPWQIVSPRTIPVSWEAAPPVRRRSGGAPSSYRGSLYVSSSDEDITMTLLADNEPLGENVRCLPPPHQKDWQPHNAPPLLLVPSRPPPLSRSPSPLSRPSTPYHSTTSLQVEEPLGPFIQEWRAPLKEDYVRAFDWMPRPEQGEIHEQYKGCSV